MIHLDSIRSQRTVYSLTPIVLPLQKQLTIVISTILFPSNQRADYAVHRPQKILLRRKCGTILMLTIFTNAFQAGTYFAN